MYLQSTWGKIETAPYTEGVLSLLSELLLFTMPRARISWRSLLADYSGHGEYLDISLEDLENFVGLQNLQYAGILTHWVESDPVET